MKGGGAGVEDLLGQALKYLQLKAPVQPGKAHQGSSDGWVPHAVHVHRGGGTAAVGVDVSNLMGRMQT